MDHFAGLDVSVKDTAFQLSRGPSKIVTRRAVDGAFLLPSPFSKSLCTQERYSR